MGRRHFIDAGAGLVDTDVVDGDPVDRMASLAPLSFSSFRTEGTSG